jgi:hypothetical protein
MVRMHRGVALRSGFLVLALLALTGLAAPVAQAGIIEDLLKLKKAREEAERQRKAPIPATPNQEPVRSSPEADSNACGERGCGKHPDDPTPDLPAVERHVRQLEAPCRRALGSTMSEWAGYSRYRDMAEVLQRLPQTVVLSGEEINDVSEARRYASDDPDWPRIQGAASNVMRRRNQNRKGVDNGAWLLDASPETGSQMAPALYAYVVDPLNLPDYLSSVAFTPVDQFLARVRTARRDQQERQICSAPAPAAATMRIPALKTTPTWLGASGEAEERPIENKAQAPALKRLYSAGVYAIHPQTGALSPLPSGVGFNAAGYGGGGTTRAVLDTTGRVLFRGPATALSGLVVSGAEPRTGPLVRTKLSTESQAVLHPKLNVLYLITGDYDKASRYGISAYRYDAGGVVLTAVEGSTAPLGNLDLQELPNFDIRIAPDGSAAYLYDGYQRLHAFRIDAATGALGAIPGSPFPTPATAARHDVLSIHPSSKFLWLAAHAGGHQGYAVQPGSGALTPLAPMPAGIGSCLSKQKLVFDASGGFGYATSQSTKVMLCTYAIDRSSGALAPMAPVSSPRVLSATLGPTLSPNGRFLYVENYDNTSQTAHAYEILALALDAASGVPRHIGTSRQNTVGQRGPASGGHCGIYRARLTFDPTGEYLYGPEWTYQAHPQTGALTGHEQDPRERRNCFVAG